MGMNLLRAGIWAGRPNGFSPLDISGCVGWWDASDRDVMSLSGNLVNSINSKPSGNLYSQTGTFRPQYIENYINGLNVIYTQTRIRWLTSTMTHTGDCSFFAIINIPISLNNMGYIWGGNTEFEYRTTTATYNSLRLHRGTILGSKVFSLTIGDEFQSFCAVYGNSSTTKIALNNEIQNVGVSAGTNDIVNPSIPRPAFNAGMQGYILEWAVYNKALSNAEILALNAYKQKRIGY